MAKPIQDMSTMELHEAYNAETQTDSQVPEASDSSPKADSSGKDAKDEPVEEVDPAKKAEEDAAKEAEEQERLKAEKEKLEMEQFWTNLRAEKKRRAEIARKRRESADRYNAEIEARAQENKRLRGKFHTSLVLGGIYTDFFLMSFRGRGERKG